MKTVSTTVVKIGGSLLCLPDLPARLAELFELLREDNLLCLIGGGQATDVVREWDRIHQLGEEAAHWLAIDSMRLTTRLAVRLIPDSELIRTRSEATDCWGRKHVAIVDPPECIRILEREAAAPLPHSWDATSDSIAAWIAREWPAERLVLAKSTNSSAGLDELTEAGAVDRLVTTLIGKDVSLFWCNVAGDVELSALT